MRASAGHLLDKLASVAQVHLELSIYADSVYVTASELPCHILTSLFVD